jgi:hypothetical protein
LRIHAFLEKWGLINYQLSGESGGGGGGAASAANMPSGSHFKVMDKPVKRSASGNDEEKEDTQHLWDVTSQSDEGEDGDDDEEEEDPKGVGNFGKVNFWPGKMYANPVAEHLEKICKKGLKSKPEKPVESLEEAGEEVEAPPPPPEEHTSEDESVDSRASSHDAVVPEAPQVNPKIYELYQELVKSPAHTAEYPGPREISGDQYGRVGVGTNLPVVRDWSDQEVLLLLEALEAYGEDWETVAKHVGDRTVAECTAKFLQLPLGSMPTMNDEEKEAVATKEDIFANIEEALAGMPQTVVTAASNAALAAFSGINGADSEMTDTCLAQCAGATYFAIAAVKAQLLADVEKDRIEDALSVLYGDALKKMLLKENHLDSLLSIQEKQHEALMRDRNQIALVSGLMSGIVLSSLTILSY